MRTGYTSQCIPIMAQRRGFTLGPVEGPRRWPVTGPGRTATPTTRPATPSAAAAHVLHQDRRDVPQLGQPLQPERGAHPPPRDALGMADRPQEGLPALPDIDGEAAVAMRPQARTVATRPPPGRAPPPVTPGMGSGNGSSSAGHTCSGLRQGPAMSRFRSGAPPAERLRRLPSRPGCRRAAALQAEDLLSRPPGPERLAVPLPVARGLQKRPSWKNGGSFKPPVLTVEDTRLAVVPACGPRQDTMQSPDVGAPDVEAPGARR